MFFYLQRHLIKNNLTAPCLTCGGISLSKYLVEGMNRWMDKQRIQRWMDGWKGRWTGNYALLSSFCRRKIILYYLHKHAFAIYSNRKIICKFIPYDQHHPIFFFKLLETTILFSASMTLTISDSTCLSASDLFHLP